MPLDIPTDVPSIRLRLANDAKHQLPGTDVASLRATKSKMVVYWMTAFRRLQSNFALQYARDVALALDLPLIVVEPLRIGYRWASVRMHQFVIEGMLDNATAADKLGVTYYPYVEPKQNAASGFIEALGADAAAVITDDYPCFFHPAMIRLAGRRLNCPLVAVDANCLMPLAAGDRTFTVAHSYRRFMQKELPKHLHESPEVEPLAKLQSKTGKISRAIADRWPRANLKKLLDGGIARLDIDQTVSPGAVTGGCEAAQHLLDQFITQRIGTYADDRNEPDYVGSSELSPHLHFGHIGPHQVFWQVMESCNWTPARLKKPNGKVQGFWGVDESREAFLDQLCTWREIGFNMCYREPSYDRLSSLPDWTQTTMAEHAADPREYTYTLQEFETAQTHDEIWNAAQRQLVREGRIHNYMRMLWGKKILHWTKSPTEALNIMIHLNNKYALDGRDPNSYSGIFWVLGRYDRAWGPVRPIFGKIRYMTSENTAKKHALQKYLRRYAQTE